jgi:hypothetical protein
MITLFNVFCWISGFIFWAFIIYIFTGIRGKTLFTKQWHFLGYTIDIQSEKKKNLTIKINK